MHVLIFRSGCMAYFFGFFGISFLDTNAMARSPSSFGLAQLDQQLHTSGRQAAYGDRRDNVSDTMCAKEGTPSAGTSVPSIEKTESPPLVPIPEGEEFSDMTNEEVSKVASESEV